MRRRTINHLSAFLAVFGFALALAIYWSNKPEVFDPMTYNPQEQKMYEQQLQLLGGKATVVTHDFSTWFASLWHGRPLAATVTILTLATIIVFRYVALHPDFVIDESSDSAA